jgi:hypothetical protein
MWFGKTQIATVEPEPDRTPLEKYEQSCRELSAIQTAMKTAEKELVKCFSVHKDPRIRFVGRKLYARVNAMEMPLPELRECERRWAKLFQAHQQRQGEVQRLKKEAGLASY